MNRRRAIMKKEIPKVTRLSDVETEICEDGIETKFISTDAWDIGLYFMEPGMTTIVFSTEDTDDGTADEWYGHAYEFYYILKGEFVVWYGSSTADLRRRKAESIVLKEGDAVSYPPNWKYVVQCTSKIPGAFLWGKTAPLKGAKTRIIPPRRTI